MGNSCWGVDVDDDDVDDGAKCGTL